MAAAVAELRQQHQHLEHQRQFRSLLTLLARKGLTADHSLAVALHQRLLRLGSSTESDQLVNDLLVHWGRLQERFGIAIDLRLFCYLAGANPDLSERLDEVIGANTGVRLEPAERVGTLSGLLWPRPAEQRGRALQSYSPFHPPTWTDPVMVHDLLKTASVPVVQFPADDWREQLHNALAQAGMAQVRCARAHEAELHRSLYSTLAQPVNVDYLQLYPVIDQIQRNDAATVISFSVKEIL